MQNNFNRSIFIIFVSLLLGSPESLFSQELTRDEFEPVYATVLADKVNIRAGYGLNFEVLAQLNKIDKVVVIGQEYGWYKIKLPKEALSFVHKDCIEEGKVLANRLRVRAGCGLNFNVLGVLKKGDVVNILEEDADWLRITPPEGCSGWIQEDYLQLSKKKFTPPILERSSSPQKKIEAQGFIDDLGKIVNRQGTHKLIRGKKILYYLKSKDINLNHYVYQNVCVTGSRIDSENSPYPVIDVEQIKAGQ